MSIEFLGIHVFSSSFVSAVFELGNKFYVLRGAEGEKGSKLYNNPGSSLLRGMGGSPPPVKYLLIWSHHLEKSLPPQPSFNSLPTKSHFPLPNRYKFSSYTPINLPILAVVIAPLPLFI